MEGGEILFFIFQVVKEGAMKQLKTSYLTLFISLSFIYAFDEPQHDKTNKISTALINAYQTKTGQKTWLVPIVSLMVLSCSAQTH